MKDKLLVELSNDGTSWIYDIESNDNGLNDQSVTLYASDIGDTWMSAIKGKKVIEVKSDGNGVSIKLEDKKRINLDWTQVSELQCALKIYDQLFNGKSNTKTFLFDKSAEL